MTVTGSAYPPLPQRAWNTREVACFLGFVQYMPKGAERDAKYNLCWWDASGEKQRSLPLQGLS